LNVLKAGLIVKHCGNRSKNDYIPVQFARKVKDIAAFWCFRRKVPKGKGSVALSEIIDTSLPIQSGIQSDKPYDFHIYNS